MVFFNWATMQMAAKIVYYGPGLCGKTSNLSYIYAKTSPDSRGEMVSLETESDRTLFFDLLPIEVGTIGGFKTRLQLYTIPGQVFYNTTRKLVLKGVDGLVFVADSQRPMRDANLESFASLTENLKEFGLELADLPMVLQYNKRDLENILTVEELNADLNAGNRFPFIESSAINGEGVISTLKEITKLTLKKLRTRMSAPGDRNAGATRGELRAPSVRPVKSPQPAPSISAQSLARAAAEGAGDDPAQAEEILPDTATVGAAQEAPEMTAPQEIEAREADETTLPVEPPIEVDADADAEKLVFEEVFEATGDTPSTSAEEPFPGEEAAPPDRATAAESESDDSDVMQVEFDTETSPDFDAPLPVKRVHVSNQMDILAELDSLRKQATMGNASKGADGASPDLDIDTLFSSGAVGTRELTSKLEQALNSDIFKNMGGLQLAIRIQDKGGDTIHSFEPVSLDVEDAKTLKKLRLRFSLDLENIR
jgi:signal recognition particle receptor subunit beta